MVAPLNSPIGLISMHVLCGRLDGRPQHAHTRRVRPSLLHIALLAALVAFALLVGDGHFDGR
jgi:hypothetical protein